LTETVSTGFERWEKARGFAVSHKLIVVLKGAHTAVFTPDGAVSFNGNGNPGMATAGSGDVLTGVITALLAQGYAPEKAARLGVWLHGYAGDAAAAKLSEESLTALDIAENLYAGFRALQG
jgi:NAD(P)H-hydrate epimerase